MTAMINRQQDTMSVEEFEELEHSAPETVRLEFVYGKLGVKAVPDGNHREIVRWLLRLFMGLRPELFLYPEQGLKVQTYRKGRVQADGALAPDGIFVETGMWADPDSVLMTVEVTSYDSDTDRRDRVEKPRAYAEAGIPVYLLIDRDSCEVFVYSRPVNGVYSHVVRLPFGQPVELPEPVNVTLDTEPLKAWVR